MSAPSQDDGCGDARIPELVQSRHPARSGRRKRQKSGARQCYLSRAAKPSAEKAGQLEAKCPEASTRVGIIGLGLRFCLSQPVEIEPGLPLNRGGCGEIENCPRAFLDRAQRRHASSPHHGRIHVSGGVKARDRDTSTLERSRQIYREHDLSQFALTIGSAPAVAVGQHYVAEVDRLLSGRRNVHDPRSLAPPRMQAAMARWLLPLPVPPIITALRCSARKPPLARSRTSASLDGVP